MTSDAKLRQRMDGQHVANALNAFSKWPASHRASEAVRCLARRLTSEPQLCQSMEAKHVSNALNALSKWPTRTRQRRALALADHLTSEAEGDARLRESMDAREVTNALNALSKWPDQAKARDPRCGWPSALARNPSCASRWTRRQWPTP
ncbi:hypothetical protein KAF44_30710 (plasmid) [Cupriavidus necator]|nr:hypothetical protein KAF44_30710 [Cupriavidus necator]